MMIQEFTSSLEKTTSSQLMQVFSLLADWHRCSSTHHRCPSANNHVANDSSVWQTVPPWFLWYLWASLSLVLAESRWDFSLVACSCNVAVSLRFLHTSFCEIPNGFRWFKWRKCCSSQGMLFFESIGLYIFTQKLEALDSLVWCCYYMKCHWSELLRWWQWKSSFIYVNWEGKTFNIWGRYLGVWDS